MHHLVYSIHATSCAQRALAHVLFTHQLTHGVHHLTRVHALARHTASVTIQASSRTVQPPLSTPYTQAALKVLAYYVPTRAPAHQLACLTRTTSCAVDRVRRLSLPSLQKSN